MDLATSNELYGFYSFLSIYLCYASSSFSSDAMFICTLKFSLFSQTIITKVKNI